MRVTAVAVDYEARNRLGDGACAAGEGAGTASGTAPSREVELNELISVGVLGLVEAANRFQPSLGVPFDAFARRRVHGAMLDAFAASIGSPARCAACAASSTPRSCGCVTSLGGNRAKPILPKR